MVKYMKMGSYRKFIMRTILMFFFVGIYTLALNAQSGPGGIGTSSDNVLWLKADQGTSTTTDGTEISYWNDVSGNANNSTQAVFASQPVYISSGINGLPTIQFDGNDFLTVVDNDNLDNTTGVSVFVVALPSATDAAARGLVSKRVDSGDNESYYIFTFTSQHLFFNAATDRTEGSVVVGATPQIFSANFNGADANPFRSRVYIDGTENGNDNGPVSIGNMASDLHIGILNPGYAQGFEGDISEVIVFRKSLNSAERIIVENYLAQKYNIAIAEDLYNPLAGYFNDMAGIGEEADGEYSETSSAGLYLTALSGLNVGDYIFTSHNNLTNNSTTFRNDAEVTNAGADEAYNRVWYIDTVKTPAAELAFDFSEALTDGLNPTNISNYVLLYRAGTTGNFSVVKSADGVKNGDQVYFNLTDADLETGYYTLGTIDNVNSPLEGVAGRTWYTLISGNWGDWEVWTLDPSGSLPNNPDHYTPSTSPTNSADDVVILTGKTVVTDTSNNLIHASIIVDGRFDLTTTTGHSFGEINGTGIILSAADNFPEGDASHFYTAGQGEGTVEYYGTDFDLLEPREYFNLKIDMDDASQKLTLFNDYVINGEMRVIQGEFQINDDTDSTNNINVTVYENLAIESNGKILTGSMNARHQLNLYADFINDGTAEFTNRIVANYAAEAADGIVDVNFLNTTEHQTASCNGPTNFYRIEIDKGTDDTYMLTLETSNAANFNLFGYANEDHGAVAQLAANNNALGLISGTVRIKTNINIPVLSTAGNYNVSEAARLWVDGGTVQKNNGNAIVPYGTIQLTSGLLEAEVGSGITTRANGLIKVEGGILNTRVIRTSVFGAGNVGGYVQSGGTVNITGTGTADYYHFCLTYPGNVFNMSGGTLHVYGANADNETEGGIFIASDLENINVTGGTVIAEISNANNFRIVSKAPFYNLILRNTNNTTADHILSDAVNVGSTNENLTAQPLVVLNDLTIEDNCFLDHNGEDITIGRNFIIAENSQIQVVGGTNNYGLHYNVADPNTLTFNGSEDGVFYQGYNVDDNYELYVWGITVNKSGGSQILIQGNTNKEPPNASQHFNRIINVQGTMDVQNGTLNQGRQSIRLYGPVNIKSSGVLGVYESGVTDLTAYVMLKDDGTSDTDIITETGAQMGNFKLNPGAGNTVSISSDIHVKRIGFHTGRMNLKTHKLKLDYLHRNATTNNYDIDLGSTTEMIFSDANASDGGIEIYIPGGIGVNTDFCLPLGTETSTIRYTPVRIRVTGSTDDGYIQIRPVDGELKTTDLTGGDLLDYYWRVSYSDFPGLPTIVYQFRYAQSDVLAGEGTYVLGKVLDENPFTRSVPAGGINTGTNRINFWAATLENANYTAGAAARFVGAPQIFYTYIPGDGFPIKWNNNNNWTFGLGPFEPHDTRQAAAGDFPKVGDIAVIGWVPHGDPGGTDGDPHGIAVDGITVDFAEIRFAQMEDIAGDPTARQYAFNFQFRPTVVINNATGALNGSRVSGEGLLWMRWGGSQADPDFSSIDIGDFVSEDSAYFVYESKSGVYNNVPSELPNLLIAGDGWGANDRNFELSTDIRVRANFELLGDINLILSSGATGDVIVEKDLRIFRSNANGNESGGFGRIDYPNDASRSIEVYGDLRLENEQAIMRVANPNTTVNESYLILHGNIIQDNTAGGGLQLYSADDEDYVKLTLKGTGDHSYSVSSGATANFYNIEFNKGTDQTSTFTFNDDFDLHGPTSGAGVTKALELQNGTFVLNNAAIDIDLTSGDDDFDIPSTSCLQVTQGTVNVYGDDTGIGLDGKLLIDGGTVDMINGVGNGNNYIEYSSSGNAEIEISSGNLWVGSQIRRNTTSTLGILQYTQSGGNVQLGVNAGGYNYRSIFEILNTGSSFTHSAGDFYIVNDYRTGATIASMYFNPETVNLTSGTEIQFGHGSTIDGEDNFELYAGKDLMNLIVNTTNSPTLTLDVVSLTLEEDIEINASSELDANGLDINLSGDFNNSGTFTANENNTYFLGSGAQQITGATTFWNLHKTTANTLTLNNDIDVDNELHLDDGILDDGDNTLSVQGYVWMDITHNWGGTSNGILMNGSSEQVLISNGTFGKLSINNSSGVSLPAGNEITIDGVLQLEAGVLDIGKNLLILDEDATIREENAFSETNMIQTNMSFTDAGVKKYYPAIVPAAPLNFIYPIGSEGKYTPVEMDIDNMDAGGFIRVKGANEMHPTIVNDTEPCNEIVDTANVLKYHWLMEASSVTGFTANASMKYYDEDLQLDNPYYDITHYIAARLLWGSTLWNKYDQVSFDETNNLLRFLFSNSDDDGISGDYTAGIEDQAGLCEGAIPDQVPAYITIANGDWTDETIWDTYPVTGGSVPSNGPRGAIAIVEHEVTIPSNYILNYKTTINATGLLKVGTTFGHRLGIVDGTGTLQLERGSLPAGIYDDFFSRTGGTLEYTGSNDYDVLSEIINVRNLKFTGTGERRLPNLDFEVYGLLTIDGDDATLEVINEHNRNMTLDSNVVFTQGSYEAGYGTSKVTMNGTYNQTITGAFTGTNAFWIFEMNNTTGVTLVDSIDVDEEFMFTSGILTTGVTNILTVTNSSETLAVTGYNSTNYVEGPMRKLVNAGDDFIFPLGDDSRYGILEINNVVTSGYWEAEYFDANPITNPVPLNPGSFEPALELVSEYEYWRVKGPTGGTAQNQIRWDSQSILPAMSSDADRENNLKMVEWITGAPDRWEIVTPATVNDISINVGTIQTDGNIGLASDHFFTLGSTEGTPLPAAGFMTLDTSICAGDAGDLKIQFAGSPDFTVYIWDGTSTTTIASIAGTDTVLTVNPAVTTTYTIDSVSDATLVTTSVTIFGDPVVVTVVPIPTAYNMTGGGSYCVGDAGVVVGLQNSDFNVNYELFAGVTSVGIWAGTGTNIDFGNQTNIGTVTYSVVATATAASCSQNMASTVNVTGSALPTANDQTPADLCSEVGGANTTNTVDLTAFHPAINGGAVTYTWYHDVNLTSPVLAPGPSAEVITKTINGGALTATEYYFCEVDDGTCTNTATIQYTIRRTPETGPQYHIENNWGN
jgi:hypothetical protein